MVEAFVAPAIARDPAARHLISDNGEIIDSAWFTNFQLVAGGLLMLSLLLTGIGLYRSGVLPRWVGALMAGGAVLLAVPLPEAPVLTGLQVEFCRGLAVAAVGLLMIRAARTAATTVPAATPRQLQEV